MRSAVRCDAGAQAQAEALPPHAGIYPYITRGLGASAAAERFHLLIGHRGFLFSRRLEHVLLGSVTIDSGLLLGGVGLGVGRLRR